MADWPEWATERVEVHPAEEAWQRHGEQARRLLDTARAEWLAAPVEHGRYAG